MAPGGRRPLPLGMATRFEEKVEGARVGIGAVWGRREARVERRLSDSRGDLQLVPMSRLFPPGCFGIEFRVGSFHVPDGIMDVIYLLGALLVWFVLIKWVLPRFGVAT